MNSEDVPADFPHEFLEAVSGAQPKLLVRESERGEYISEAQNLRAERWAICGDLCEQLVGYLNKHPNGVEPRGASVEKVVRALDGKRSQWGISRAETDWIAARLRAAMKTDSGQS